MFNITLFSKDQCPGCSQVKEFLDSEGYEYEVKDVVKDANARLELLKKGFMSVPVADINGELIVGAPNIIKKIRG